MADLGTISGRVLQASKSSLPLSSVQAGVAYAKTNTKAYWTWLATWHDSGLSVTTPNTGTISGVVTESGTPIPYCVVRLYYRKTGAYIRQLKTDTSGSFSFAGLNPSDTQAYFCIAFDPEGGVQYNAIVFDRLTAT